MSNHPHLPTLSINKLFMAEFITAPPPCFGIGLMDIEQEGEIGFLAMRPSQSIPSSVTANGFRFGHSLLGTSEYVVIQFVFEFYGFGSYYILINPNMPVLQTVLSKMINSGKYFFLAMNPDKSVTTFRSTINQGDLAGLQTNFPKIQSATTTAAQYQKAVTTFSKNPKPAGTLMNWVCRDYMEYLDLTKNRLDLNPS